MEDERVFSLQPRKKKHFDKSPTKEKEIKLSFSNNEDEDENSNNINTLDDFNVDIWQQVKDSNSDLAILIYIYNLGTKNNETMDKSYFKQLEWLVTSFAKNENEIQKILSMDLKKKKIMHNNKNNTGIEELMTDRRTIFQKIFSNFPFETNNAEKKITKV